jgi:hypothetical protein
MPIGATIGAAVVGAGASIYSSSKASKAQTSAANDASQIQLQVADENNQLARDMYAANAARLDPYSSMGLAAGAEYMGLLGVPFDKPSASTAPPLANGGSSGSSGSGASLPFSITSEQNDGIPGNYQTDMTTYFMTHPPTPAELAAMKDDGIAGNYQAALAAMNATGSSPPTLEQINAMKNDGIPHNYNSALAAYNASQTASPTPTATPTIGSALSPVVAQQAQAAIAAGADPVAVQARAAQFGARL